MFRDQNPFIEEHAWKNWSLSLHATAHMRILCDSCACDLYVSHVIPMHAVCMCPM